MMWKYTMFSLRLTNSSFKQQISIGVPELLYCLGMRQFKLWSAVLIYSDMYCYPLIVFDVDTSSFAKKVAQNVFKTSFFCCQVQGSLLMEKKLNDSQYTYISPLVWIMHKCEPRTLLTDLSSDMKWPIIFELIIYYAQMLNTGLFLSRVPKSNSNKHFSR